MDMSFEIQGLVDVEVANTPVDKIDAEEVNLIGVYVDESGSMDQHINPMCSSLKEFQGALVDSKEIDCILAARGNFHNAEVTIGGYKKIEEFDTSFIAQGMTPMYDAIVEGAAKLSNVNKTGYMDFLLDQGMRVKAVFAVFSDGGDTSSSSTLAEAKKAIQYLNDQEIVTAFISFGSSAATTAKALGFKNILSVGANASELRMAFNCLSKSVIESSKSVTGNQDNFFQL
jgi:hypothetical protein